MAAHSPGLYRRRCHHHTLGNATATEASLGSFAVTIPTTPPPSSTVYLSDLTPTAAINGWGPYERDRSNGEQGATDGATLTINGTTYAKGLGVHADSSLTHEFGHMLGYEHDVMGYPFRGRDTAAQHSIPDRSSPSDHRYQHRGQPSQGSGNK